MSKFNIGQYVKVLGSNTRGKIVGKYKTPTGYGYEIIPDGLRSEYQQRPLTIINVEERLLYREGDQVIDLELLKKARRSR